jgi:hypothetical protein
MELQARTVEVPDRGSQSPTWLEPMPHSYRKRRGLVAFGIGAAVAVLLLWMQVTGGADMKATLWAILALGVGSWRFRVWQQRDTVRKFAYTDVVLTRGRRLRKALPLLALGFIGAPLIWGMQWHFDQLGEHWVAGLPFVALGLAGVFVFAFLKTEKVLTLEAAPLKAQFDAEQAKENERWADVLGAILAKKYVRYPGAAALLYFAYDIAQDPKTKWIHMAAVVFWALVAAYEVSLWLLGAGLVVGVLVLGFNLVAALPVSVAIVVGALIIAGAVKK